MNATEERCDRAAGCVVGAFIGDALGLGPHWYYDLDELHRDFGDRVNGYISKPAATIGFTSAHNRRKDPQLPALPTRHSRDAD